MKNYYAEALKKGKITEEYVGSGFWNGFIHMFAAIGFAKFLETVFNLLLK